LQIGFKRGYGTQDAIFLLKAIVNHFTSNKSTVFATALDISTAFYKIMHGKLIKSLMNAGIPSYFIDVVINWYAKLTAIVRWNHALSKPFYVKSGVIQGGVLSPSLFNIFINVIITNLKLANNGCFIKDRF
jgi:Reverse transcriptase (RNA-dependent DNA polymerase)